MHSSQCLNYRFSAYEFMTVDFRCSASPSAAFSSADKFYVEGDCKSTIECAIKNALNKVVKWHCICISPDKQHRW